MTTHSQSISRTTIAPQRAKRRPTAQGVVLLVAVAIAVIAFWRPRPMSALDDRLLDIASSAGRTHASEIRIVAVDDDAIKALGGWPFPKNVWTQLLERLRAANAGLIAIDARIANDIAIDALKLPLKRPGGVDLVLGYTFYPRLADMPAEADDAGLERGDEATLEKIAIPEKTASDAALLSMAGIRLPAFAPADRQSIREGFGNLFPDKDGVVRSLPLAVRFKRFSFPSLAFSTIAEWRSFTPIIAQDAKGRPTGVAIGEQKIRTGSDLRMPINWRGEAGSFAAFSIADVVAGKVAREEFDSRIVLVGMTAPNLRAGHPTPLGRMADVEILANALDNLLLGRPLVSLVAGPWAAIAVLLVGLLFAFVVLRLSMRMQLLVAIATGAGAVSLSSVLLRSSSIQIPAASIAVAAAGCLAATLAWRLVKVELPRMRMRRAFSGRLTTKGIDAIVEDPSLLSPAGKLMDATALAIDIKWFGSLSDRISPAHLAELMREYRMLVTEVLFEAGAFIDSWAGDECRAVFGAPAPIANHELAAVRAALLLRRRFIKKRTEWRSRYRTEHIGMGIGIQSGAAVAGDLSGIGVVGIGVMGAAVEAACQLRALNRLYHTSILVGEDARKATEAHFAFRPLDRVLLRGDMKATTVFDLVGETGTILPQLHAYMEARDAYLRGNFARAASLFKAVIASHPNDGPSHLFLQRSIALTESPPDRKWDGVWRH